MANFYSRELAAVGDHQRTGYDFDGFAESTWTGRSTRLHYKRAYVEIPIGAGGHASGDIVRLFEVRNDERLVSLKVYCQDGLTSATADWGYFYPTGFRPIGDTRAPGSVVLSPPYPSRVTTTVASRSICTAFDFEDGHNGQDVAVHIHDLDTPGTDHGIRDQSGHAVHFAHWQRAHRYANWSSGATLPYTLTSPETWNLGWVWTATPAGSMSLSYPDPFVTVSMLYTTN